MKKLISIISLGVFAFFASFSVKALSYGGCEYSEISRLRNFVSNINLSFDYYIQDNQAYFDITISNLIPDIYFVDSVSGNTYYYSNSYDGEITIKGNKHNGHYKFYSALEKCYGIKLSSKYYKLPTYNTYFTDTLCQQNKNFSLCQKWINVNYSYNEFKKMIDEYNNQHEDEGVADNTQVIYEKTILDELVNFYTQYYYIILISIIVVCVVIMIISRRKNKFDL